jgi:hypothetical protein
VFLYRAVLRRRDCSGFAVAIRRALSRAPRNMSTRPSLKLITAGSAASITSSGSRTARPMTVNDSPSFESAQ